MYRNYLVRFRVLSVTMFVTIVVSRNSCTNCCLVTCPPPPLPPILFSSRACRRHAGRRVGARPVVASRALGYNRSIVCQCPRGSMRRTRSVEVYFDGSIPAVLLLRVSQLAKTVEPYWCMCFFRWNAGGSQKCNAALML